MINPYIIIALMVLLAGTAAASYSSGVTNTNNARDAELLVVKVAQEALELQRGQESADIIQEVLDEQDELERTNRKLVDKAREIERTSNIALDAERLQLWKATIASINSPEAIGSDAATAATSTNQ